jgi:hypothetical protein
MSVDSSGGGELGAECDVFEPDHDAAASELVWFREGVPRPSPPKAEAPIPVPVSVACLARRSEDEDEGIVKDVENYRHFIDPPPESFVCQICKDVFLEPVILTGCGHTFCHQCIMSCFTNKTECPSCRRSYPRKKWDEIIVKNFTVEGSIEEMRLHCKYGLHKNDKTGEWELSAAGCKEVVKICGRSLHESKCPFAPVLCGQFDSVKGSRCEVECLRSELRHHRIACPFRVIPCPNPGCEVRVSLRSLETHQDMCGFATVHCPAGCRVPLKRKDLIAHIESACPEQLVDCPFARYGCSCKATKFLRKCLPQHFVEASCEHLVKMSIFTESEMRKLNNKIEHLSKTIGTCKVQWRVPRFAAVDVAYSKPFDFGGYRWSIHTEVSEEGTTGFFLTLLDIGKHEKLTVRTTFTLLPLGMSKTGTSTYSSERPSWGVSAWNVARMQEREATVCLEFSIREKSTSVESAKIKYRRLEEAEDVGYHRRLAEIFQGYG